MIIVPPLEWTKHKTCFRATTTYGTYWIEAVLSGAGYQLICGTNPCCERFSTLQDTQSYSQQILNITDNYEHWFSLPDVSQSPYQVLAHTDLCELLRTYETLLSGDNLPERIALQTADLQRLLSAAKSYILIQAGDQK